LILKTYMSRSKPLPRARTKLFSREDHLILNDIISKIIREEKQNIFNIESNASLQ